MIDWLLLFIFACVVMLLRDFAIDLINVGAAVLAGASYVQLKARVRMWLR